MVAGHWRLLGIGMAVAECWRLPGAGGCQASAWWLLGVGGCRTLARWLPGIDDSQEPVVAGCWWLPGVGSCRAAPLPRRHLRLAGAGGAASHSGSAAASSLSSNGCSRHRLLVNPAASGHRAVPSLLLKRHARPPLCSGLGAGCSQLSGGSPQPVHWAGRPPSLCPHSQGSLGAWVQSPPIQGCPLPQRNLSGRGWAPSSIPALGRPVPWCPLIPRPSRVRTQYPGSQPHSSNSKPPPPPPP